MQVRGMTPDDQWPQVSRTLAQLQSIIRVRVSQEADIATAALSLANAATVLPPQDTVATGGSGSSSDYDDAIAATPAATSTVDLSDDDDAVAFAWDESSAADVAGGTGVRTAQQPGAPQASAGAAGKNSQDTRPSRTAVADVVRPGGRSRVDEISGGGLSEGWSSRRPAGPDGAPMAAAAATAAAARGSISATDGVCVTGEGPEEVAATLRRQLGWFAWRVAHGPLTQEEAAALDALLMRQTLALAQQAHFGGAPPPMRSTHHTTAKHSTARPGQHAAR